MVNMIPKKIPCQMYLVDTINFLKIYTQNLSQSQAFRLIEKFLIDYLLRIDRKHAGIYCKTTICKSNH